MKNARILVVDDSAAVRQNISNLLAAKGYQATTAPSAEAAAREIGSGAFDLVITDIIMPGMSGLNLLKLIKEGNPETEVVIITSNASSFTAIKALRLGAYDFIIKPIDDEIILYNIVDRALEKQALARENRRLVADLSKKNRSLEDALRMMRGVNAACALIATSLDVGEILQRLVESAVETLDAAKGYLLLLEKGGSSFQMKVRIGIDPAVAREFRMGCTAGISGLVAASGEPVCLGRDIAPEMARRMIEEDTTGELFTAPGILSVPLKIEGKVAGVVCISGRKGTSPFGAAETEFLTALATHAAVALKNAGAFYRLKKGGDAPRTG